MNALAWTLLLILTRGSSPAEDVRARPPVTWPAFEAVAADDPARAAGIATLARRRRTRVILAPIDADDGRPVSPRERAWHALAAGADGWSFAVRSCADSALVLAVSGRIEDRWDGFGVLRETTWPELCLYRTRDPFTGRCLDERPVFAEEIVRAAVLTGTCLAVEPIGSDASARLVTVLSTHRAFPNLVFTPSPDPDLPVDLRYRPLPWKALLTDPLRALERSAVRAALAGPGQLIWTPAPRLAAEVLSRPISPFALAPGRCPDRVPLATPADRSHALAVLESGHDAGLDPLPACRRAAALLVTCWPESAASDLLGLLGDPRATLAARAAASWGIGRLAAWRQISDEALRTAGPLLLSAIAADPPLGPTAMLALGRLGERRLAGPARKILAAGGTGPAVRSEAEFQGRQAAATALGLLDRPDPGTIEDLILALGSPTLRLDPQESALDAAAAARALGALGSVDAIDLLERAAIEIDPTVRAFWESQEPMPRPEHPGLLVARLRREAIAALARIPDPRAEGALRRILDALVVDEKTAPAASRDRLTAWAARAWLSRPHAGVRAVELLARRSGSCRLAALAALEDPKNGTLLEEAAAEGSRRLRAGSTTGLGLLVRVCRRAADPGAAVRNFLAAARGRGNPELNGELDPEVPAASPDSRPDGRSPRSAGQGREDPPPAR